MTDNADKIPKAVKAALQSLGEPAVQDLAKYIKGECGFNIDNIRTAEELVCLERVLRQIFGTAGDLLIQLMHQELEK